MSEGKVHMFHQTLMIPPRAMTVTVPIQGAKTGGNTNRVQDNMSIKPGSCNSLSVDHDQVQETTISRISWHPSDSGLSSGNTSDGAGSDGTVSPVVTSRSPSSNDLNNQKLKELDNIKRNIVSELVRKLEKNLTIEISKGGSLGRGSIPNKRQLLKSSSDNACSELFNNKSKTETFPRGGIKQNTVDFCQAWKNSAGATPSKRLMQLMGRLHQKISNENNSLNRLPTGRKQYNRASLRDSSLLEGCEYSVTDYSCDTLSDVRQQLTSYFNSVNIPVLKDFLKNTPDFQNINLPHSKSASRLDMTHQKDSPLPVRPNRMKGRTSCPASPLMDHRPPEAPSRSRDSRLDVDKKSKHSVSRDISLSRPPTPNTGRHTMPHDMKLSKQNGLMLNSKENRNINVPNSPVPRSRNRSRIREIASQFNDYMNQDSNHSSVRRESRSSRKDMFNNIRDRSPSKTPRESLTNSRSRDRSRGLDDINKIVYKPRVTSQPPMINQSFRKESQPLHKNRKDKPPLAKKNETSVAGRLKSEVLSALGMKTQSIMNGNSPSPHPHRKNLSNTRIKSNQIVDSNIVPKHDVYYDENRKHSTDSSSSGVSGCSQNGDNDDSPLHNELIYNSHNYSEIPTNEVFTNHVDTSDNSIILRNNKLSARVSHKHNEKDMNNINGYNNYIFTNNNSPQINQHYSNKSRITDGHNSNNKSSSSHKRHTKPHDSDSVSITGSTCDESEIKNTSKKKGRVRSVKLNKKKGTVAVLIDKYSGLHSDSEQPTQHTITKPVKKLTSSRMSLLKPKRGRTDCSSNTSSINTNVSTVSSHKHETSVHNKENKKHSSRVLVGGSGRDRSPPPRARRPAKDESSTVRATTINISIGPMQSSRNKQQLSNTPVNSSSRKSNVNSQTSNTSRSSTKPSKISSVNHQNKRESTEKCIKKPKSKSRLIRKETFRVVRPMDSQFTEDMTPSVRLRYLMQRAINTTNSNYENSRNNKTSSSTFKVKKNFILCY